LNTIRNPRRKNGLIERAEAVQELMAPIAAELPARGNMPRLLTLRDLADHYRIPRSTAYELMGRKALDAVKLGGRTLILTESVERLLASLPRFGG